MGVLILLLLLWAPSSVLLLQFNSDGTFKIVQFTDMHYGEAEDTLWGPEQDVNSTRVMRNILADEQPDFVIFTGDLLTGNNIDSNATEYWKEAILPTMEFSVPWAATFGNHDDLASGVNGTRLDLMTYDMTFPLSLSQIGPPNIHGVSNYVLSIQSSSSSSAAVYIYILDSGDTNSCQNMTGWGCVWPDQVTWYMQQSKMRQNGGKLVPSLSFFHIPLQEYMFMWNDNTCYGTNNDSVACQSINSGLFSAFLEMGDVQFVSVGHNHGNDFCGDYNGITLCYGRHSGYGGYGTWERGARVIQLTENPFSIKTWIRFEDGRVETQEQLHTPSPPFQTDCY